MSTGRDLKSVNKVNEFVYKLFHFPAKMFRVKEIITVPGL